MGDGPQADAPSGAAPPGVNLRELVGVLWRRRAVLAGCVLTITTVAVLLAFQQTPRYTAKTQVLIDPRERNVADVEAVLSGLSSDASTIESQIQVIRSRSLATRAVEQLGLDRIPEFNSALREPGVVGALWGRVVGVLATQLPEVSEAQRVERERSKVVDVFLDGLRVTQVGRRSFVIAISFTSENARLSSRVSNKVAELYLVEQLEAKFEATERATDWLNERLADLRARVEEAERLVEAYSAEHGLVSAGGLTVDEQQLSEINGQLILARAHLAEKRARFRHLKELLQSGAGVESLAEVLASDEVSNLRRQQADLARERADLESRYGDRHPLMIKIRAQGQDVDRQIESEVNRIVANLEHEVTVARSRSDSLGQSLARLQARQSTEQVARIRLRELEREAEANRALYESFLGRFKETSEQAGVAEADARIISRAAIPDSPSYPPKAMFAIVGLVMSLGVGLGAIVLLERLDNGFRTAPQMEALLSLPHLSAIPELSERDRTLEGKVVAPQDYVLRKPLSAYSEALRSLRSALLLSNIDSPPRVVAVTSAMPSEGKTTMTLSLARASAQSGTPTLVIDADLRRSSIARTFGLKPKVGLVECLTGDAELKNALILDEASGLSILPVVPGSAGANPPELLGSDRMKLLLEEAKKEFALVLIDSAPVLAVSDTRVLGKTCDTLVFIVQWEKTPRGAAEEAIRVLRQFDVPIAGVVFSRLDLQRHARYGYGDSYSYYGKYSRYYTN